MTKQEILAELEILTDKSGQAPVLPIDLVVEIVNLNNEGEENMETAKGNLIAALLESIARQQEARLPMEFYVEEIIATENITAIVAGIGLVKAIAEEPEQETVLLTDYNLFTGQSIDPYEAE